MLTKTLSETESYFALSTLKGLGPSRISSLVKHFGSARKVLEANLEEIQQIPGFEYKMASLLLQPLNEEFISKQMELLQKFQFKFLDCLDPIFPNILKQIYAPPPFIYGHGNLAVLQQKSVAVVGTRNCSEYGKSVTQRIVRELVEAGLVIVSGLARGIDTLAHSAALRQGGKTVAVLGCGLDTTYPPENRELVNAIVKQNGAVISELPLGTLPEAHHFPERNRIISGLSLATIIIEADMKSGSLITAQYALDQNREVFAIPGRIDSEKSQGTHWLIKTNRAKLVQNSVDILTELNLHSKSQVLDPLPRTLPALESQEEKVYRQLTGEPKHIDQIAESTAFPTSQVLGLLLSLELKGLVVQIPGKNFQRCI